VFDISNAMRTRTLLFVLIAVASSTALAQTNLSQTSLSTPKLSAITERIGISYMSFFDGPGILGDDQSVTPNALGKPADDGLVLLNNISFKYELKKDFAIDFQARFHYVMNNAYNVDGFEPFRWQSPRVGISTTFFKTENSKLNGAFNSDLPYTFPEPIGGGYISEQRTTLATPGMFAKYTYAPVTSKWSVFSLVQPRFYLYKNRNVAEPQLSRSGYSPLLKNEFTLSFSPSVNYAFTDKFGSRFGTELVYKKLIVSDWNPFNGTTKSADPDSKAWRIQPMPMQLGFTYNFSKMFELSTYFQGYPVGSQRIDKKGRQATFEETVSAGAWISGVIL
jgi:hypothetical protein